MRVATIVEGHGEVSALPILLRRFPERYPESRFVELLKPIRVHRDRFLNKEEEFRRQLLLAASKCGEGGLILVLLDADDDCPAELGARLLQRAKEHVPHRQVSVVLANREFEAWFIASAVALDGHRGFRLREGDASVDPEIPRDAKGWLRERMATGAYSEILDQPAFASCIDLDRVYERSRSFRKLCDEWRANVVGSSGT